MPQRCTRNHELSRLSHANNFLKNGFSNSLAIVVRRLLYQLSNDGCSSAKQCTDNLSTYRATPRRYVYKIHADCYGFFNTVNDTKYTRHS